MRMHVWLLGDAQIDPRVCCELPLIHTPIKELLHVLEDACLSLPGKGPDA